MLRESLGEQRPQQVAVGRPVLVPGKSRIGGQFRRADNVAQLPELHVIAGCHDEVAVLGGQGFVREQAGMRISHPHGHHAAGHDCAGLVHHAGQCRGHQAHLDVLSLSGGGTVRQRGEDAVRGVQAGDDVEDRDTGPVRRPGWIPGQAHQAGHGLHHEVVAGQVAAFASAESADRGVDDGRVDSADGFVVQAEPAESAGLEVLHEYVGPARELARGGEVALIAQVQRDRALVAVDGQVVRGRAVACDRRHPAPGVIARGALNFYYLGTEVGQQHRAVRPGQDTGEVGDEQARQRSAAFWRRPASSFRTRLQLCRLAVYWLALCWLAQR